MDTKRIAAPILAVLVAVAVFAAVGQYAGAAMFVKLEALPDGSAGIFTLLDYWKAYGDVLAVKRVLVLCTALSVVIAALPVVVAGVVIAAMGKRALHGDARFATDREIRKSGLVGDK
jgi:type IV secretory pathway TraG/TraD family ATPase VirD4